MLATASDPESLHAVARVLAELEESLGEHPMRAAARAARDMAMDLADVEPDVVAARLLSLTEAVRQLRAGCAAVADEPRGDAAFDPEMVELLGEFVQETEDGLTTADHLLVAVEQGQQPDDVVDQLFRVFHTAKGGAGFLELDELGSLAHASETLLDRVRRGELPFSGDVVDLVLQATGLMSSMLQETRRAVETGRVISKVAGTAELIRRLESFEPGAVMASSPGREPAEEDAGVSPRATESTAANHIRETVKVDLERVDRIVEMIGELVIVESMVLHAPEVVGLSSPRIKGYLSQLEKITGDLQDVSMSMRMVPVRGVFQKMARMARDLGRRAGKKLRFVTSGDATEIDRSLVEHIGDPLVHMMRNAVDHGVESPQERRQAGKDETATIRLSAYHEGGNIVIELSDDGRGLDTDAIRSRAIERGVIEGGDNFSDAEVHALIFAPGFSTAASVSDLSGRGVGMDVVKRNIEAVRGRVSIETEVGGGTTFRLLLPLTLAIIEGMLVRCGDERYIVPTLSVVESLKLRPQMLVRFADQGELIDVRGEILPLIRLHRLFDIDRAEEDATRGLVVIIEGVGARAGLLVDDVVTQQQVVIKSLGAGIDDNPFTSGAAILSDGTVGLILNVEEICALTDVRRRPGRGVQSIGGTLAAMPAALALGS